MSRIRFASAARFAFGLTLILGACSEPTAAPQFAAAPTVDAVKFWETGASVAWNNVARDLIRTRNVAAVFPQGRILTYLSVAQYNAIVAAEDAKDGGVHASPAAAAAGASVVVLKKFFPLDAATLDATLLAQKKEARWPGERHTDFAAGEAIGREIGAEVLAYAATDGVGLTPLPVNPRGPGNWTGAASVLGHYGARTFALTSGDQFRPGPPLEFQSPEFNAALAEVRSLTDNLTPEQIAFAKMWAPQGPAWLNGVAVEMITDHRRTERDAARILALANMAAFDVMNACFDAKLTYYYIRPYEADPMIKVSVTKPNHPSYPSGHSCITSTYATILADAFPQERERLEAMVQDAGFSRMLAGLHFRFECEVGQQLGQQVAEQVLRTAPHGHAPIPLD